jgi:uncharacterized heparinase superfamily protein
MDDALYAGRVFAPLRLPALNVAEAAYRPSMYAEERGRHHTSRRLGLLAPPRTGVSDGGILADAPELGDPATALQILRNTAAHRFFSGAGDEDTCALLRERFPEHCGMVVAAANAIVAPMPWHRPDGNAAADPAIAGEPNRHQWIVRLAQAHALTRESRYAEACVAAIDGWLAEHPTEVESTFANSPETGFRLVSWCWTLLLLRHSPDVSGLWVTRVIAALRQDAIHVERSLSDYCPPPTHLTGNALALLYAGTVLRELPEAARWRDIAVRVLTVESQAQIGPDGVHFEQSTCFQWYTADVYLQFLVLAAGTGIEVAPAVAERVVRMFEFILAIRRPDGTIPAIGDSDGGSLLPLAPRAASDARGRLAVAAALFGRADFAWAAGCAAPEVAWLMGGAGVRMFDSLHATAPAIAPSRVFPTGGYAVMRTGWQRDAHQMIVDVGALGCPVSSGHGHADLLSIQCSIFGEPIIVDPGTHCYGGDSKWRDYFRSTSAHSTVVVDGVSQAEAAGPFGWRRHPRVRLREWHSTPEFDFLDAEHDGYTTLPDPVTHRRRVIFVKPGYWILVDDLAGTGRHEIDLSFQFASADVRLGAHPWARAATPAGPVLWISPFPSAPAQPALKCGDPAPTQGWISPEFAHLSPAPMLIYTFAVALPWRIVTLLLPDRQGLSMPPAVRPIYDDGGLPQGFVFERPRRVVRFDDRAVSVERD